MTKEDFMQRALALALERMRANLGGPGGPGAQKAIAAAQARAAASIPATKPRGR